MKFQPSGAGSRSGIGYCPRAKSLAVRLCADRRRASGTTDRACRSGCRGQSTVEFMLMLPVILAIYFFLIQMGLYFSTIHYATYSAFTLARAQQVGFSQRYPSLTTVADLIMTGLVWLPGDVNPVGPSSRDTTGVSVSINDFDRRVPFPFLTGLEPTMQFDVKVFLGPRETCYEYVEGRPARLYDTNFNDPSASCSGGR